MSIDGDKGLRENINKGKFIEKIPVLLLIINFLSLE